MKHAITLFFACAFALLAGATASADGYFGLGRFDPLEREEKVTLNFLGEYQAAGGLVVEVFDGEEWRTASGGGDPEECISWWQTEIGSVDLVVDRIYEFKVSSIQAWSFRLHAFLDDEGSDDFSYGAYFYDVASRRWGSFCADAPPSWHAEMGEPEDPEECINVDRSIHVVVRKHSKSRPWAPAGLKASGDRDAEFGAWTRDEGYGDPTASPGDETPLSLSHFGEQDPAAISIRWSMETGRLWDASSAGALKYIADRLVSSNFTAAALTYTPRTGDTNLVDVLPPITQGAAIEQIKTPQILVNVVSNSATSFQLNVFSSDKVASRGSNGYFQLVSNATNFVTWKFESPATDSLRITELRPGYRTNLTSLVYDSANKKWTLTRGTNAATRVEQWTITTNIASSVTNRIEAVQIGDGTNVTENVATHFRLFNWGYEKIGHTNDPGGLNLVTLNTYVTDTNAAAHTRLLSTTFPNGATEQRAYFDDDPSDTNVFARLGRITRPWMDGFIDEENYQYEQEEYEYDNYSGASVVRKRYDAPTVPTYPITYILHNLYSADCSGQGMLTETQRLGSDAQYGDSIVTTTFGGDDVLAGRVYSRVTARQGDPSIMDAFDYEWGSVTNTFTFYQPNDTPSLALRQTVFHGSTNEQTGWVKLETGATGNDIDDIYLRPFRSTKDVYIIKDGYLVAKQKWVFVGGESFSQLEEIRVQRDVLGHVTNAYRLNLSTGLPLHAIYQSDWSGNNPLPGNRKISETDASGIKTSFTYDELGRVKTRTRVGATLSGYPTQADQVETITYDSSDRIVAAIVSSGSLASTNRSEFDRAGRVTKTISPDGMTNTFQYLLSGSRIVNVTPSGAVKTNDFYLDGRLKSVTGNAEVEKFYTYSVTDEGSYINFKTITDERAGSATSERWRQSVLDTRHRASAERWPAFRPWGDEYVTKRPALYELSEEDSFYISMPEVYAPTVNRNYHKNQRDVFRDLVKEGVSRGSSFSFPLAGIDQLSVHTNFFTTNSAGDWFFVKASSAFLADSSDTATAMGSTWTRITGLSSNQISETIAIDSFGNTLIASVSVNPSQKTLTEISVLTNAATTTILRSTNVTFNGLLQHESTFSVAAPTWHYYDALGREIASRDPLGNVSGTRFDALTGWVLAVTNTLGQVTSFSYYLPNEFGAGQKRSETDPAGKTKYFSYNSRGQLTRVWGSGTYPEERTYNSLGDMVSLGTFQGGSGWSGSSWPGSTGTTNLTLFYYDEGTGLLTNKVDALGAITDFDYYDNYEIKQVTWARTESGAPVWYKNYLAQNGDLTQREFSDGTSVYYDTFDRRGLPRLITDTGGNHVVSYDLLGRQIGETVTNGLLSGITLTNTFNYIGRSSMALKIGGTTLAWDYGYDSSRRLGSVTNGTLSATYGYVPNSDLVQTMTGRSGSTTVMTTTRVWDGGVRLRSIENRLGSNGAVVSANHYLYDAAGRRTHVTQADGSAWRYGYNNRDEVTSGTHYFNDWTPMPGQQFEYAYDNIGNRDWVKYGGDETGQGLRVVDYGANALNQISTRSNATSVDIIGAVMIAATNLTVNGDANVFRKGEYFWKSVSVANTTDPLSQSITNSATLTSTNTTLIGSLLVPEVNETFTYDADGNLTADSLWNYKWDPQNRLIELTSSTDLPATARLKLTFKYDHHGRRIQKIVYPWSTNTSNWNTTPQTNLKFLYDGWLLLAELNATNNALVRSYSWGADVIGLQYGIRGDKAFSPAAGIGGLLNISTHTGTVTNMFAVFDGNGNVTSLIDATANAVVGQYAYDSFGGTIYRAGQSSSSNPFQFSTRYTDAETGHLSFALRWYSPQSGRWLGRDPIDEAGGRNLYAFAKNRPLDSFDVYGCSLLLDLLLTQTFENGDRIIEYARGMGIIQRVRSSVRRMESVQMLWAGVMEAQSNEFLDLVSMMNFSQEMAAAGLRGDRSLMRAVIGKADDYGHDQHHIWPRQFFMTLFRGNINIDAGTQLMDRLMHQSIHPLWNQAWERIRAKADAFGPKSQYRNPYFLLGFGLGLALEIGLDIDLTEYRGRPTR